MSKTYKTRYGFDWPAEMPDELIGLTIGKKWREYKEQGVEFKDPWVPMLDAMKSLYTDEYFKVSEWTEQHVHDWVMEPFLMTWGCASSSKALLLDEPVYYADRVGTVGGVRIGDHIMDAVGGCTEVVGIREQEGAPLYRVEFSDGTETICSEDHLWEVEYYDGNRKGRVTKVLPVKVMANWSARSFLRRGVSVPTVAPVAFSSSQTPVDPYVIGCLLGDGCIRNSIPQVGFSSLDTDIRDRLSYGVAKTLPGCRLVPHESGRGIVSYRILRPMGKGVTRVANPLVTALKDLGLFGLGSSDKFIPDCYKFNSLDGRLELLAGMFDTDGSVSKDGFVTYSTVSKRLADDLRFVLESIGAVVTVREREPVVKVFPEGKRSLCRRSYVLTALRLPAGISKRLFHLRRKRDRVREAGRSIGRKHIRSVSPVVDREKYPSRTRCLVLAPFSSTGEPSRGLFPIGHFTVTHNSNDTGALIVADWITDPMETVTLLGSTTKDALRFRSWESVERYFGVLKNNAKFLIPGKITQTGYAILNDRDASDDPNAQGAKAGIHGVALNDGGKLQGAHLPYVRLVVDEIATIANHNDILTTIENLQISKDFKFVGLANPEAWSNPSCQYAIPEKGVDSVNADTGSWRSTFGCFVRHHNGLKSPCIVHPELADKFPFLTQKKHVDAALKRCMGNYQSPQFQKMVIGFPLATGNSGQVVLDESIALRNHVTDGSNPSDQWIATAAGVDPAWTENGDSACYARCLLRYDQFGKPYLDFTNGVRRMTLDASVFQRHPAVEQLRNQVINFMREPYAASFRTTAIDSSGNQSLADDLIIYAAAQDILAVNFAARASEEPLRAFDVHPVKETVYDRGTEAWCVLAEFCRAGQVKGLPMTVVEALTQRRYAANMVKDASGQKVPAGVKNPLRLEDKEEFKKRYHGRSPDECDACAMAALAIKERCGLLPFGYIKRQPDQSALVPQVNCGAKVILPVGDADFGTEFDDTDDLYGDI